MWSGNETCTNGEANTKVVWSGNETWSNGRLHDRLDSLLCYDYEVLTYRKEEEPAAKVTRKPRHGFIHFSTSLEVSLWWVPVLGCVVLDSQVAKNSGTEGRNIHQTQHHTCSHTQHNTHNMAILQTIREKTISLLMQNKHVDDLWCEGIFVHCIEI